MPKKDKANAHEKKMLERRIDNERRLMCRQVVRLILPDIYLILAEKCGFRNEELKEFNSALYGHLTRHQEKKERAAVHVSQVIEILIEKYNIDPEIVYGIIGK